MWVSFFPHPITFSFSPFMISHYFWYSRRIWLLITFIEIQLNCEEGLKECTIERSLLSSFGFVFIFFPSFPFWVISSNRYKVGKSIVPIYKVCITNSLFWQINLHLKEGRTINWLLCPVVYVLLCFTL